MRKLRAGVVALGLLALAGCADPHQEAEAGDAAVTVSSCGQELAFETTPERVVTLDQTSTETMLALGLGDRMIGTSNLKTKVAPEYQEAYAKVPVLNPKLLTGEQLRAAAPDLVIASFAAQYTPDRVGTREELAEIGLPSYVSAVECPSGEASPFDLLFTDFKVLGEVFGVEDRATALIEEQQAVVDAAAEVGEKATGEPSILWLYSSFNGIPYVAGGGTVPSEMSRLVGGVNAFDDVAEDWPEVSWERIAERDPDVIVVGDLSERGAPGDSAAEKIEQLRAHPVLSQLAAVKNDQIIEVLGTGMDPSVRAVETLEAVVAGMRELGHVG